MIIFFTQKTVYATHKKPIFGFICWKNWMLSYSLTFFEIRMWIVTSKFFLQLAVFLTVSRKAFNMPINVKCHYLLHNVKLLKSAVLNVLLLGPHFNLRTRVKTSINWRGNLKVVHDFFLFILPYFYEACSLIKVGKVQFGPSAVLMQF